jgi:hypothetical protein
MPVHPELAFLLEQKYGRVGVDWSNGTPNASCASASVSCQRLKELIDGAAQLGYETRLSGGTLIFSPKP